MEFQKSRLLKNLMRSQYNSGLTNKLDKQKTIYKKAYSLLSKRDYSVAVMRKNFLICYTDSSDDFCEIIIEEYHDES